MLVISLTPVLVFPFPVAWFGGYLRTLAAVPTLSIQSASIAYSEGAGTVQLLPGASASNASDGGSFNGGLVRVGPSPNAASDRLAVRNEGPGGITVATVGAQVVVSYLGDEIGRYPTGGPSSGNVTNLLEVAFTTAFANDTAVTALLGAITFEETDVVNPPTGARPFTVTVRDAEGEEASGSVTVNVTAVNDPPILTVPGPLAAADNADVPITSASPLTAISVADEDVGPNPLEITVTATNGNVRLTNTAGLISVSGNNSPTLVFRGDVAADNARFPDLVYRSNTNVSGTQTLTVVADDLEASGPSGLAGRQTDTETIDIVITPVNDPPVVTVPGPLSVNQDTTLSLSISVADPDAAAGAVLVSLSVVSGTLTVPTTAGVTISNNGTTAVTLEGQLGPLNTALGGVVYSPPPSYSGPDTLTAVNAALATLTYRPNPSYTGADTLNVGANDLGNTDVGGPLVDTETVAISVGGVSDAPRITLPGPTPVAGAGQPVLIDPTATVEDLDTTSFGGATLTVDVTANATSSDRLGIRDQGTEAGQIGVSGSTITFGGVAIGTASGGTGSTPLVVSLNARATLPAIRALVRNLAFQNVSPTPSLAPRTVRVMLTEAGGLASAAASKTVRLVAVADLSVTLTAVPEPVEPSNPVTYMVVVSNAGPLTATGVVATVALPSEVQYRSATASQGGCSGSTEVTCRLGAIPAGGRATITIVTLVRQEGDLTPTVRVTSATSDPNEGDNRATVRTCSANPPPPVNVDESREREQRRRETEEQRQQRERTNRSGHDDYRTEGNVVEVDLLAEQPTIVIALRDGLQQVLLTCLRPDAAPPADGRFVPGCPSVLPGDYLEASGVKEHEGLFYVSGRDRPARRSARPLTSPVRPVLGGSGFGPARGLRYRIAS